MVGYHSQHLAPYIFHLVKFLMLIIKISSPNKQISKTLILRGIHSFALFILFYTAKAVILSLFFPKSNKDQE
jgi:hypothetical protein